MYKASFNQNFSRQGYCRFPKIAEYQLFIAVALCSILLDPSVRPLVRVLKHMQRHVPGLRHLNSWYLELLVSNKTERIYMYSSTCTAVHVYVYFADIHVDCVIFKCLRK